MTLELWRHDIVSWRDCSAHIEIIARDEKIDRFYNNTGMFLGCPFAIVWFFEKHKFTNIATASHYKDLIYDRKIIIPITSEKQRQFVIDCLEGRAPQKKWWHKIF